MDGFTEKKWFVYLIDHHEGPFSLAEIQAKIAQNQISISNYVWAEGLSDWKPMASIREFDSILNSNAPSAPVPSLASPNLTSSNLTLASTPESTTLTSEPTLHSAQPTQVAQAIEEKTGDLDPTDLQRAKSSSAATNPLGKIAINGPPPPSQIKYSNSRALKWGIGLLVPALLTLAYFQGFLDPVIHSPAVTASTRAVSDFAQPHLLNLADQFPTLGKWISPIPALDDVSPEDFESLKAAARSKLSETGPKVAVALSTADSLAPSFYLTSNLPDGTVIDVYIEGVPETLLNQLSFTSKIQATLSKKLGKTASVRYPDGKPLPRGEYIVYVTENPQQPQATQAALANVPPVIAKVPSSLPRGLKLLVSKPVFLGGDKDATYISRLKEYHDKLRAKASAELSEVKQFASMLDSQLGSTVAKFTQLRSSSKKGKLTPAGRKTWNEFHSQWSSLNDQLVQSYAKWTPEALQNEYFYGILYTLTQQAGQAVEAVHALQSNYFEGKLDPKAFEIQLGTSMSGAQSAIAMLKAKLDQAERLAPTANGMPRREGL